MLIKQIIHSHTYVDQESDSGLEVIEEPTLRPSELVRGNNNRSLSMISGMIKLVLVCCEMEDIIRKCSVMLETVKNFTTSRILRAENCVKKVILREIAFCL